MVTVKLKLNRNKLVKQITFRFEKKSFFLFQTSHYTRNKTPKRFSSGRRLYAKLHVWNSWNVSWLLLFLFYFKCATAEKLFCFSFISIVRAPLAYSTWKGGSTETMAAARKRATVLYSWGWFRSAFGKPVYSLHGKTHRCVTKTSSTVQRSSADGCRLTDLSESAASVDDINNARITFAAALAVATPDTDNHIKSHNVSVLDFKVLRRGMGVPRISGRGRLIGELVGWPEYPGVKAYRQITRIRQL